MFKVNNKNIRTTSLMSPWYFYCVSTADLLGKCQLSKYLIRLSFSSDRCFYQVFQHILALYQYRNFSGQISTINNLQRLANLMSYDIEISGNQFCQCRSNNLEMFIGKAVLKICSKFTGERQCRSVILIKLLCNFIKTTL